MVTAVSAGSANITYTVTGCNGPASASHSVTVNPDANAGSVSGTSPLCIGGTATYSSTGDAGGTWSSDNGAVATVNPTSGLVTAVSAGSANITYTVTGCNGPASASQSVTVNASVNAGTVTGTSPLCIGGTATYSSTGDAGGTWSSDNGAVATVNPTSGLVTAVSAGSANITYTVTGCNGPASASQSVTVNASVNAGTVTGTSPLCIGGTAT
ncbi:MAG: Ig-like domain-containing protein, partial [Sphingobacteriales bacterium]|nr:Ig-like domain-containing protein [Sphingobacteriales bacterium]